MTRREALKNVGVVAAACAVQGMTQTRGQAPAAAPTDAFTLPALPYPTDALEPHIDARTMEIHHDKHHAAYVANLNKAIASHSDLASKPLEELVRGWSRLPADVQAAVRNQGGGHYNHSLFWQMMKRNGGGEPGGELAKAIEKAFGSYAGFKDQFTQAATRVFGSGWVWLINRGGGLAVEASANQDLPASLLAGPGGPPATILLGIDVWEHAYYLKYQNRRPDYIAAWFNTINWDFAADRFSRAAK